MATLGPAQAHSSFATFGTFLRFLRRRARLTQRELAVAVNYSEGQICHLEHDRRTPELATLVALFVPALDLEADDTAQLLALAAAARAPAPADDRSAATEPSTGSALPRAAIPAPPTPLIGRAEQRATIGAMLCVPEVRLVTLIGPAGVGKTHLALQLAQDLRDRFRDGVRFIDLSAITQAALVVPTVAQALDLAEDSHQEPLAALQAALREQRTLLVLDNLEQVVDVAPVLADLLAAAPGLTLLLTSRVALRLRAEHVVGVPPLVVPDLGQLPPLDTLAQIESVALLLARLRAANPDLTLTAANALPLAAICVRVDGLPLAIELVASRGRLLSPQELLSEVAQRFRQLRQRGHDVPSRHRTLTAALSWSHEQLSPGAQALFARLSVFVGRWSIDSVEPVCDLELAGRDQVLDQLDELIEHSLIQRHDHHGETRLAMLMMVHEYAQEQLRTRAETDIIQDRLLAACIDLAERAEEQLYFSAEQELWMARMEAEHDTIRAAMEWAVASGAHALGLRLVGALWRFWYMRGKLREGRQWLATFLALPLAGHEIARAHALDGAAILAWRQGEYEQAQQWLHTALDLYRGERHRRGEARVLTHIGLTLAERGMFEQALTFYEASLPIHRELGDSVGVSSVLHNLGNMHCQQNNHELAMALYTECLELYQQHGSKADIALISLGIGVVARDQGNGMTAQEAFTRSLMLAQSISDDWTTATALKSLGDIACDGSDISAARRYYDEALAIFERLGDQPQIIVVQLRQGILAGLAGDRPTAIELFRQCLMMSNALGFQPGVAGGLEGLASCAAQTQPLQTARLLAAAAVLRESFGIPIALAEQPRHQETLRMAQRRADSAAWAVAWAEGRRLPITQAITLALTHVRGAMS